MSSITPDASARERNPARDKRFRALRHLASEFTTTAIAASAWHQQLHALSATCENLSLHGLLLRLGGRGAEATLCAVTETLSGLHVTLHSGEVLFHGDATIRHLRTDGSDLLLGVALCDGALDLSLLHQDLHRTRFAVRLDEAERLADCSGIRPAFKEWVADLSTYLSSMRAFLDQEEAGLRNEDRFTREQIISGYLADVAPRVVERVHGASHRMEAILGDLSPEQHAQHRAYAQRHLLPYFLASPLMRRALEKPLGYAGDYEMMNMLYRVHSEGESLFGQIINQCAAREIAARANINRVTFLTDKLRQAICQRTGDRVLLASIGSGPAREIETLLEREPQLGRHLDVMLIDQDEKAIAFCERRLSPLAHRTFAKLHYVRESVRRLLTGGSLATTLGPRDLIYSAGLFDYLSDRSFSTLLSSLYDAVRPGGQLLVGNVNSNNPTRYFMEYFLEWFLVHRSPQQLLAQTRLLRVAPRACRVESEPLGVNLFLILEK